MLEYLPKLFFKIINFINAAFFAFVVYLTYVKHYFDFRLYFEILFLYVIMLIFHAIGSMMSKITYETLEYDSILNDDEENC